MGGSTARRLGAEAKKKLDPTKAYRDARFAVDDSPTVGNQMRLAQAERGSGQINRARPQPQPRGLLPMAVSGARRVALS